MPVQGEARGRQSERLQQQNGKNYKEARQWTKKETKEVKRTAGPTKRATRVGIKLWWWIERKKENDAAGPRTTNRVGIG